MGEIEMVACVINKNCSQQKINNKKVNSLYESNLCLHIEAIVSPTPWQTKKYQQHIELTLQGAHIPFEAIDIGEAALASSIKQPP